MSPSTGQPPPEPLVPGSNVSSSLPYSPCRVESSLLLAPQINTEYPIFSSPTCLSSHTECELLWNKCHVLLAYAFPGPGPQQYPSKDFFQRIRNSKSTLEILLILKDAMRRPLIISLVNNSKLPN